MTICFAIAGAVILCATTLTQPTVWLNQFSKAWLDPIIDSITDLGLGGFWVVVAVLLLFYRYSYSLILLTDLGLVALFTYLFKEILFPNLPRPLLLLNLTDLTRWVDGADTYLHSSFPSGHTMTAFAVCTLLAYWIGRKGWAIVIFFFAFMVGFSRVYMLQHFLRDVFFGAIYGTVISLVTIWFYDVVLNIENNKLINKSLLQFMPLRKKLD
ncbi:MAG: phosphatase PAP2 family protein [Bacteroidota bacterium]|nr:phosphatase PAP2 family protein [Bacteroidota bacterium]